MTTHDSHDSHDPRDTTDVTDTPLAPWMLTLAREAVDELDADVTVPREMMWARIERERRTMAARPLAAVSGEPGTRDRRHGSRLRQVTALAAVLVGGVAIGRYMLPSSTAAPTNANGSTSASAVALATAMADSIIARRSDPSHVAMQEHLVRTVSLLAAVQNPAASRARPDLGPWAGELLTTTRLLLDQPQLRDERTRRLLQDLELVLVQIVQARSSAPETQRAPQETMRETDLLTRVRAVVTASNAYDGLTYGEN